MRAWWTSSQTVTVTQGENFSAGAAETPLPWTLPPHMCMIQTPYLSPARTHMLGEDYQWFVYQASLSLADKQIIAWQNPFAACLKMKSIANTVESPELCTGMNDN